ncbi:MAG: hypothetical protein KHZ62_00965 [Clostridiales bacterium]|nr:hypothetical protein [Clostridiales bacterium]
MEEKEILQNIAVYLQKKYNGLNEIENLTKQLQDALSYGDRVTIRMLIKMRQEEMDQIDQIDLKRTRILNTLSESKKRALKKGDPSPFLAENEDLVKKIAEIEHKNHRVLEKLIEQDKFVNRRLAGDKSYYH